MKSRLVRILATVAAPLLLGGCQTLRAAWGLPQVPACSGVALPAAALPGGDFRVREQVRMTAEDVEVRLTLVVERRGGRMVGIGLNEFGATLFTLVQEGGRVKVESDLGGALQLDPETLWVDWQTARLSRPEAGERIEIRRPGCSHQSVFVQIERVANG
ncbi:MAG: DUF3261 domain-containing protein [Myxococcota bacterium]